MRDYEERKLAEIEKQLIAEDPKLAAKLSTPDLRVHRVATFLAAMLGTYVAGLVIAVAGMSFSSAILTVAGTLIAVSFPVRFGWRAWRQRAGSRSQSACPH
jgi:hypothetical protein